MSHVTVRRVALFVAMAVVSVSGVSASQAPAPAKIDVTGSWAFEVRTDAGSGTPQVTFKQDGEKLTGHYSSAMLGEADLTGTVKGQAIQFSLTASVQGTAIELSFSGTLDDNDSMKGTVSFGGLGEGSFTGKRK